MPTAGNPDTQWRPMYPNIIYERSLFGVDDADEFVVAPVIDADTFFRPIWSEALVACPTIARKLAEMDATELSTYLDPIVAKGTTYHDIGMIWGGRLLSKNGLFAAENVDLDSKPTSQHLIFLTDGQTEAFDIAYGAYGVEPLDQRRWSQTSALTLTQTIEARFAVACQEVRKRNITIWVIAFGTDLNPMFTECAGPNHFFAADDAVELNAAFSSIASTMGDLRISK